MRPSRRDALKMMASAPMLGLFGKRHETAEPGQGLKFTASDASLPDQTLWREFEPPYTSQIAFPLGGIGTGTVSLGGRGDLRDWEIVNSPDKGRRLENTFFALWYQAEDGKGRACILEAQIAPPYPGWMGYPRDGMPGMPRFKTGRFLGAYPFARVELSDPDVPLQPTLEAFNPFIPLNDKDSGLPVAIFYWRVKNTSRRTIPVTVLASQLNIAGNKSFGKNLNEFAEDKTGKPFHGIRMTCAKHEASSPNFGTMTLATTHEAVTYQTRWARSGWFDDQSIFWDDFSADGKLERKFPEGPTPDNRTDNACLGLIGEIEPGETAVFPFVLAWHFPNRENKWNSEKEVKGKILKNFYATQFADAWEAARYTLENLERLENETRLFQRALFSSTLPPPVLDAVSSQSSTIRSNVCFRTEEGNFYGFEGVSDDNGCCPLDCTHVWNYEQSLAFLFPQLERKMREVDFRHNTLPEGNMAFRTLVPLGDYFWAKDLPCADGQMGCIVKLYREWKLSGDADFLRRMWPDARRALEYAWKRWDKDKDGVMEGIQHNTYDIEFHGPNPFTGVIYLCALRAGEEIARALGDETTAHEYRAVFESGRKKLDEQLWNGEFYIHKIETENKGQELKYQLGKGCLSDQMLGQWMAHVVDLGYLLPPDRVRSAMRSIYDYNWKPRLDKHYNPQRIYALGDEAGLLVCSWPKGDRLPLPFPYSDEVWTGIEYHVAAHLIYEGMIEEGLNVVAGARSRHDGRRRNPWDEIECGHHYARAMSSWSLLLALSGFHYDASAQRMTFAPVVNGKDFRTFWSCGSGWGTYRQKLSRRHLESEITALYGNLSLFSLRLPKPANGPANGEKGEAPSCDVWLGDSPLAARAKIADGRVHVGLETGLVLPRKGSLRIRVSV